MKHPCCPVVAGYRLRLNGPLAARIHVSADERYELYLDGAVMSRGPDRGDLDHWTYKTYQLNLPAGVHWLAARVWSLGDLAPVAQLSLRHGFLLAAEQPELSTGTARWQATELPGHRTRPKGVAWGCGAKLELDGRRYPWGWQIGNDTLNWGEPQTCESAVALQAAHDNVPPTRLLAPSPLPEQTSTLFAGGTIRHVEPLSAECTHAIPVARRNCCHDEVRAWQSLLTGRPLIVPAGARRRVVLDLGQYVCAYPHLGLSGGRGSRVRIHWQETLFNEDGSKGNRGEVEGKFFTSFGTPEDGVGDVFIAGGGQEHHTTLWWEAGRYVEIVVETADTPLTLTSFALEETHYPYLNLSTLSASDGRISNVMGMAFRTLEMCSHETSMDCPFYEQLQYAGDARIQAVVAYVTTGDDRLGRQAIRAFKDSLDSDGMTRSRYPSRIRQTIPPFSLWWISMVHDFALWRGDLHWVASLMPGVRSVLDAHRRNIDDDGLLRALPGWNFTDWAEQWPDGVPPTAPESPSAVLNFQLVHVLTLAAELETWVGDTELADRDRTLADRVRTAAERTFWSPGTALYADDADHQHFSEHAQALSLLAGAGHGSRAAERTIDLESPPLTRATGYFDHYLFEAYSRIGRVDAMLTRLSLWFDYLDSGLITIPESPDPSRSDCHAWGSHPIFHAFSSILGIRPVCPGMRVVKITPDLGTLEWATGSIPTPMGSLTVRVRTGEDPIITAPSGMTVIQG